MAPKLPEILVVDDEPLISNMLYEALTKKKYGVTVTETGTAALEQLKKHRYDLIITDLYLPDVNGIEILKTAKNRFADCGVIVITAHSSVESAVEAMRMGAYDYLTKGFSLDEIELTVEKFFKYQRLVTENELLRSELGNLYGIENIIGKSPKMQEVFETVEMVAPTNVTVLIQGASGTGKELIAKAIHRCSSRRDGPFIKTNCAAMPEGLIESELFGHEKGAFTGALRSTKGRFEMADGGTLLLDEISEIKPSLQAKLLRVLQEKEFERVGNPETLQVDVRVIATTNRDLTEEIKKGNFREDLFYRLNVVPITLPLLRERKEDIPLLVEHFIEKYARENGRDVTGIADEALEHLLQHDWPGNVRELENTIERAVVVCKEATIRRKHLYFANGQSKMPAKTDAIKFPAGLTLREMEKHLILHTLHQENGNRTRAAEKLGITVRTLRNKLREYREEVGPLDPSER
ncbi:MAG: sigma-54-dependent Fis family transcriptional regulator [Calditrichaeota bacterium]|nr:MAG: sigma-54-dependent Fis family transcriptional regulator [Calditrichota bacterium]